MMIIQSNIRSFEIETTIHSISDRNVMTSRRSRVVREASDEVSREVVSVDAHHERAIRSRLENFELSTDEHGAKRATQHFRETRNDDVRDPIS